MTPDERHDDVVSRHPGGITPKQFRHETLASADAADKLDPPALADWFMQKSLLIGMWMEGLIELRGTGRDQPMWPWFITNKGRAAMSSTPNPIQGEGTEQPNVHLAAPNRTARNSAKDADGVETSAPAQQGDPQKAWSEGVACIRSVTTDCTYPNCPCASGVKGPDHG